MKDIFNKVWSFLKTNKEVLVFGFSAFFTMLSLLVFFAIAPGKIWTLVSLLGIVGFCILAYKYSVMVICWKVTQESNQNLQESVSNITNAVRGLTDNVTDALNNVTDVLSALQAAASVDDIKTEENVIKNITENLDNVEEN